MLLSLITRNNNFVIETTFLLLYSLCGFRALNLFLVKIILKRTDACESNHQQNL